MPRLTESREHKIISAEELHKPLEFVKKYMGQLDDADDRQAFSRNLGYMETAEEMLEGDNMRATCLYDAASKYANQLAFRLFIEENLSESAAAEFRELEPMKVVAGYAREYTEENQAEADAITAAQHEFMEARKPFEVFQAVIGGMSKEEAEAKQAAYERQKAQALANAATQA